MEEVKRLDVFRMHLNFLNQGSDVGNGLGKFKRIKAIEALEIARHIADNHKQDRG